MTLVLSALWADEEDEALYQLLAATFDEEGEVIERESEPRSSSPCPSPV